MARVRFIGKETEKFRTKPRPIGRKWKKFFYCSFALNIIGLAYYLTTII